MKLDGPDKLRITAHDRQADGARSEDRPGADRRHRVAAGAARHCARSQSTATHDVQVRLERPQVSVVSTKHYINLGGSEMVVYRATPADVTSGVLVGDIEYPGYPGVRRARSKA